MKERTKRKLYILIPFAFIYFLFNYLPVEEWIPNEWIYLAVKISIYIFLANTLIYLKRKNHIEIETPTKQISLWWLLPMLIICFTHPLYIILFDGEIIREDIEIGLLVFDVITDLFVSIVEDVLFVDIYIAFLIEIFSKLKNKRFFSILFAAITFTIAHGYVYLYNDLIEAIIVQVTVFFLIMECGYLAIYFDSALIPIGAHLIFNVLNFVIFDAVFIVEKEMSYFIFTFLVLLMSSCYLAALYHMSVIQIKLYGERKEAEE